MKKRIKNSKGFAMAELLAVSGVIMLLFSILFSNYLPILAEYETRIDYNNVTAEYAGHYLRKIYKEVIDSDLGTTGLRETLRVDLEGKTHYTLYQTTVNDEGQAEGSGPLCSLAYLKNNTFVDKCNKIVEHYGVKEVTLTKYNLGAAKDLSTGYKVSDGSLYDYIQYLPKYSASIYSAPNQKELYRFVIKTNEFGYATTPVDSSYVTPNDCFKGTKDSENNITITGYDFENPVCSTTIIIPTDPINVKNANGTGYTGEGVITAIGTKAFYNEPTAHNIDKDFSIIYGNSLTTIGESAFEKSRLIKFATDGTNGGTFAKNITSIGNYAFKQSKLPSVVVKKGGITYGKEAFNNIENLEIVDLEVISAINESATALFAYSGNEENKDGDRTAGLLVYYGGLETINDSMFMNTKLSYKSLKFYKNQRTNEIAEIKTIKPLAYSNVTVVTKPGNNSGSGDDGSSSGDDGGSGSGGAISEDDLENGSGDDNGSGSETGGESGTEPDDPDEPDAPVVTAKKKDVTFPYTIEKIEDYAFYKTALDSINFTTKNGKSNIEEIGFTTFASTESETKKTLTIPDSVNNILILGGAFSDAGIEELALGDDNYSKIDLKGNRVENIITTGQNHFANNYLRTITLNNRFCSDGTLTLSGYMFKGNKNRITSVTLPNCKAAIPNRVFEDSKLTGELVIPSNITAIGSYAFRGNSGEGGNVCRGLQSVVIPQNSELKTIGKEAFSNNNCLTSFTVSEKVETIGENTFVGCVRLGKVNSAFQPTEFINYSTHSIDWCLTISDGKECSSRDEGNNITVVRYQNDLGQTQNLYIKNDTRGGD